MIVKINDNNDKSNSSFIINKSKLRLFNFFIKRFVAKNEVIPNEATNTPDIKIKTFWIDDTNST
jgi:hypothetical protein